MTPMFENESELRSFWRLNSHSCHEIRRRAAAPATALQT
jgi:hypothetical protein